MINNIEGLALDIALDLNHDVDDEKTDTKRHKKQDETTIQDLQNAIKTMTLLFPEETRPTGEETKTFNARLESIVEQMETLSFQKSQRPFIRFSLLSGPDRRACKDLKLHSMTLEEMLSEGSKKVLFDSEVQGRRVTRWSFALLEEFRKQAESKAKATASAWNS